VEGRFPVMLEGQVAGELTAELQGVWTVLTVRCGFRPGILRLSLYGDGREFYLGVPAPEEGALVLRRRLSPAEAKKLPGTVDAVEEAGKLSSYRAAAEAPVPPTAAPIPPEEALYWYASPDGILVCFDGTGSLVALPAEDPRLPPAGGELRRIEGRDYRVFRTRDGRLLP